MNTLKISELKESSEIDEEGNKKNFLVIKSCGHKKGLKRRIGQTTQFEPVPKFCDLYFNNIVSIMLSESTRKSILVSGIF